MSNRPAIPAEMTREILLESGHRCAVCGTPCPLERAHIIPWRKSRAHKARDLICLCANCHERADKEEWGEKTLREYKRKPWVIRQYQNHVDSTLGPTSRVIIELELEHLDKKNQRWLQYGLAAFLEISPNSVRIASVEKGSVKVTVELPQDCAVRLLRAYEREDAELTKYLAPLILLHLDLAQEGLEHLPTLVAKLGAALEDYLETLPDPEKTLYIQHRRKSKGQRGTDEADAKIA